jgi:hypothetical protein
MTPQDLERTYERAAIIVQDAAKQTPREYIRKILQSKALSWPDLCALWRQTASMAVECLLNGQKWSRTIGDPVTRDDFLLATELLQEHAASSPVQAVHDEIREWYYASLSPPPAEPKPEAATTARHPGIDDVDRALPNSTPSERGNARRIIRYLDRRRKPMKGEDLIPAALGKPKNSGHGALLSTMCKAGLLRKMSKPHRGYGLPKWIKPLEQKSLAG